MAAINKHVAADGKTSYRVRIWLSGYPTQTASLDRLTDARRWATQTEASIRDGRYFKTAEAKKHRLAEAIERYQKRVLPAVICE